MEERSLCAHDLSSVSSGMSGIEVAQTLPLRWAGVSGERPCAAAALAVVSDRSCCQMSRVNLLLGVREVSRSILDLSGLADWDLPSGGSLMGGTCRGPVGESGRIIVDILHTHKSRKAGPSDNLTCLLLKRSGARFSITCPCPVRLICQHHLLCRWGRVMRATL